MVAKMVNNLSAMQETQIQSLGWEDPLDKGMATHSSILAWKISWTEEPDGLQSWACKQSDISECLTLSHTCCCCSVTQLFPTLWDPMDYSLLISSVHGIILTKILEWVAMYSSRGIFPIQYMNSCLLCLLHWQGNASTRVVWSKKIVG